jgi:hypothetical protein
LRRPSEGHMPRKREHNSCPAGLRTYERRAALPLSGVR